MTDFYDVNELNIIIRRSNKPRLFEDSAQKAIGKKNVKRERARSGRLQTVGHSHSLIRSTKAAEGSWTRWISYSKVLRVRGTSCITPLSCQQSVIGNPFIQSHFLQESFFSLSPTLLESWPLKNLLFYWKLPVATKSRQILASACFTSFPITSGKLIWYLEIWSSTAIYLV